MRLLAAPTINSVSASPTAVPASKSTLVTVTALITDPTLVSNSVNLLRVDPSGKSLGVVGVLRDDGLNGDVQKSDRVFTIVQLINEPTIGEVRFQVSAAFKGVLKRASSNSLIVNVWQPEFNADLGITVAAPPEFETATTVESLNGQPTQVINLNTISEAGGEGQVTVSAANLSEPVSSLDDFASGDHAVLVSRQSKTLGGRAWLVLEEQTPGGLVISYYHLQTPTRLITVAAVGTATKSDFQSRLDAIVSGLGF